MVFEKIECTYAFYDEDLGNIFYAFETIPKIDDGEWSISQGGDVAYNLRTERLAETGFPEELLSLLDFIPDDIEIDGLEEE